MYNSMLLLFKLCWKGECEMISCNNKYCENSENGKCKLETIELASIGDPNDGLFEPYCLVCRNFKLKDEDFYQCGSAGYS